MDWIYVSKKIGSLLLSFLVVFSWVFLVVACVQAGDLRHQMIVASATMMAISAPFGYKMVKYLID